MSPLIISDISYRSVLRARGIIMDNVPITGFGSFFFCVCMLEWDVMEITEI